MAANVIYRGPHDKHPRTVSDKTVTGAYLPGTFITEGLSTLTQATAFAPMLRILAHRDFYAVAGSWFGTGDPLKTAYAAGETGVAYILEVGQQYQAAVAAATYTFGQELAVGAAGRLVAAASGDKVVAFFTGVPGAKAAGDLVDVEITNFYSKA